MNKRYCCVLSIVWVKDAGRILLVDTVHGTSWVLQGAEMAAWELLAGGYTYERLAPMLTLILSLSEADAELALTNMAARWLAAGIIQETA